MRVFDFAQVIAVGVNPPVPGIQWNANRQKSKVP